MIVDSLYWLCVFQGKCYSGNVTKNQFARILAILGMTVQPEDFRILCKKFEEQHKGDINYPAFVQAIDYCESILECHLHKLNLSFGAS